ncbi:hypothetical protein ACOSQ2_019972 [Xanthoceras sorbifolium]
MDFSNNSLVQDKFSSLRIIITSHSPSIFKSRAMEIFPETLKKVWNFWEIRSLVLLSLSLQIILILFGSQRKINNPHRCITIFVKEIVWCAYTSADWVATVALSVMASNEADSEHASSRDRDSLQAFWAPFLLLLLGWWS